MGRLSDIVGRKEVYLAGLAIFVIGAAWGGFSTSVVTLILSKLLQGCGSAMIQGTGMAMLISTFPSAERGKALGFHLSVVGAGGIAGPALGGLLVGALSWRWVFFINVPVGILAMAVALLVLDRRLFQRDTQRVSFDWVGAALSAAMLITFLMVVTNGHRTGWASPAIVVAMLSFAAMVGAFVWWELRIPAPMLDLRLFKRALFSLGVSASFILFLAGSSVRFLIPFYLQPVLGYSPGQVGLILVPAALSMVIMGPVSGRLSDRYGWRVFNVGGMALSAAGLLILSRLTETSSLGLVMAGLIAHSCGMGMFHSPNNSSILSTVEHSRYGVVSALLNLVRNAGNVTGIAIATAIVTATMASMGYLPSLDEVRNASGAGVLEAFTSGLRTAYLVMGCLLASGVVVSFLKGDRPKEALVPRAGQEIRGEAPVDTSHPD